VIASKKIRKGEVSRSIKQREFQAAARTFGTGRTGRIHSPWVMRSSPPGGMNELWEEATAKESRERHG